MTGESCQRRLIEEWIEEVGEERAKEVLEEIENGD